MSLSRLIKAPIRLFKKEVITFLIIRRHDLGEVDEKLRYVSVKPTASISVLRQKIWHLLELPDYCEEIIVLKSGEVELPLTELRVGNDPQHPFLLEVWLPETHPLTFHKNMLTMGESQLTIAENGAVATNSATVHDDRERISTLIDTSLANASKSKEKCALNRRIKEAKRNTFIYPEFKKPDLTSRISSTSVFKLYRKKSKDSFTNILLKIQSDLSTLSNKLSTLENRIPQS